MNIKVSFALKFFVFLFFSVLIFFSVSCSESSPDISSIHKVLVYEFNSAEDEAIIKLSVFITSSQDIRRSKSIEVFHPKSNLTWKIDNPQIYSEENKNYFGHSALVVPEDFIFPEGIFEVTYFDVADKSKTDSFNVTPLSSMKKTENSFVKAADVISRKAGTECTLQKIILFDEIGKELFLGLYSSQLNSDEKILKLFPDAVTKRIYFSNSNNSVVILLPEEKINKE